jgi:surfactin synthase thioesterase subunit
MQAMHPESKQPVALFLSGRRSPEHACDEPLSNLADGILAERLAKMGGISAEFAAEPEFLRMALPKLRYDLSLNEAPLPVELRDADPKISAPFWIYRGAEDCQSPEALVRSWQNFTAEKCVHSSMPGDHFFVINNSTSFMPKFVADLKTVFRI